MGTNSTGCTEWERDFDPATEQPQAKPLRVKPLEPRADAANSAQQLVARIKRSSKYAYQAPEGGWFKVRLSHRYPVVSGNNNAYELSDVVFGVRLDDGTVVDLAGGKRG